jgi:hypothetical protein
VVEGERHSVEERVAWEGRGAVVEDPTGRSRVGGERRRLDSLRVIDRTPRRQRRHDAGVQPVEQVTGVRVLLARQRG